MDNGSLFDSEGAPQGGTSGELQPYEFPFTGEQVRAGLIDGEPWLVAPDVCYILKHSNVTMALKGLDDDEHLTIYRGSSEALNFPDLFADQRIQQVKLINESGLYSLVMRSKVPAAKEFKKWVTAVIRQIRQTGSYSLVPQQFDPTDLDHVAQLAAIAADQKRQIEARDEKIKELLPGHELAETYAAANGTVTIRTFARNVQQWAQPRGIKVLQKHVFDFLGIIGMVIRAKTSEKGQATATALKAGWCVNATTDYDTNTRGTLLTTYARLTPPGVDHAWKRVHSAIGEFGTLDPKVIRP